jgi:hypothetical protein
LDVRPIKEDKAEPIVLDLSSGDKKDSELDAKIVKESLAALSTIHHGLKHIQLQQMRDRHRLDLHSETNNKNYQYVFLGSVFETLVFIAVAVFQVCFCCNDPYYIYYAVLHSNQGVSCCILLNILQMFFVRRWFAQKNNPKAKAWA